MAEISGVSAVEDGRRPLLSPVEKRRAVVAGVVSVAIVVGAFVLAATSPDGSPKPLMLLVGAGLGLAFERGRFCFYCIFGDAIKKRQTSGLQSIFTALAVGAVGHAVIFGLYLPNSRGEGLPPSAHISPVSEPLVVGAFVFGLGMVLSGACISGHLYRLGQGYLRAIPALSGTLLGFGLGFLTWNTVYLDFVSERSEWWLPRRLGYGASLLVVLVVLVVLSMVARRRARGVEDPLAEPVRARTLRDLLAARWGPVATGAFVGGLGVLSYLRLEPLGVTAQLSTWSRTFMDSREMLPEVLHGIDVMKGCVGIVTTSITENGWLVIGLVGASFASATAAGRFRPERPTVGNSATALVGGILLGWGSMTALGCTIGNLLSGTQAFATSGIVFGIVCFLGVWFGLKLRLDSLFGTN